MNIAYVVPRYLPHLGGVENHVAALSSRLAAAGHTVTVATQREGDAGLPDIEEQPDGSVVLRFASGLRTKGHGLSPMLLRWVRRGAGGADLVHLQNFHAVTTLGAAAVAPKPFLLTPHYLGPAEGSLGLALHTAYSAAMRRALRRSSRIICVTASEASAFAREVGVADRCRIVPNGVATSAIRAAAPVEVPGRLLVIAGRLEEYKQPQLALEALALLPEEYRLAVLGSGPMEPVLRARARELDLGGRVLFPGRLPAEEVYGWLRAAEVVLALSRRECFGLTVAEGLAAGSGVVASAIGAHQDVVALAASASVRLVSPDALPAQVAEAVQALEPPVRDAPVLLPSWDDVALTTEQLYVEILEDARR